MGGRLVAAKNEAGRLDAAKNEAGRLFAAKNKGSRLVAASSCMISKEKSNLKSYSSDI